MKTDPLIFSGTSHDRLASRICDHLQIDLGRMRLARFPDGETSVQLLEEAKGRDVFVVQSIAGEPDHYLFELLIIIDALKRASSRSITAIIPYLGYCRQDRKNKPGVPITAKLVADVLVVSGITGLITCDLHADQVEGFFEVAVEHIRCQRLLGSAFQKKVGSDCVIVAPDIGSIKIAESTAKFFGSELVVIKKDRMSSVEVRVDLIGNVQNKNVLIVDDLCSTAGTLVAAVDLCQRQGAKKVCALITHGLFVGDAIKKIESSALEYLFVTDTVERAAMLSTRIEIVSVAQEIAEVIGKYCVTSH